MSQWISAGLDALDLGRPGAVDDVTVQLAAACDTVPGRRAVLGELESWLTTAVTAAWRAGWQPADIHRVAARSHDAEVQSVLLDALILELAAYPPATVHPSWQAQLRELEARHWWDQSASPLQARHDAGAGWFVVLGSALVALHVLARLPRLEQLTPIPGERVLAGDHGTDPDGADSAADVDLRILSRVRQLLAKAESTTFEAEAETFTAGAQKLMARHRISVAMLAASESESASGTGAFGPSARRIGVDNPYESPKAHLLTAVARANGCRMVWTRELGFGTVIGFDADLEGVEILYTSLLVQATRAMTSAGSRVDQRGRSTTRAFRSSFLLAYATRIGQRLEEVAAAEQSAAAAEITSAGGGQALVPLLAAREAQVESAVSGLFPRLKTSRTRAQFHAEGWHTGTAAADQARLDARTALPG